MQTVYFIGYYGSVLSLHMIGYGKILASHTNSRSHTNTDPPPNTQTLWCTRTHTYTPLISGCKHTQTPPSTMTAFTSHTHTRTQLPVHYIKLIDAVAAVNNSGTPPSVTSWDAVTALRRTGAGQALVTEQRGLWFVSNQCFLTENPKAAASCSCCASSSVSSFAPTGEIWQWKRQEDPPSPGRRAR